MTVTADESTSDVRIRDVERADLLAIHSIERASFPSPWPLAAFEQFLSSPGFLVAVEGGVAVEEDDLGIDVDAAPIAGYVVADLVPNHGRPLGHVKDLAVHPDRRGRGIGTRLLTEAIARLDARSAQSVKLEVRESNDPARSLYREFDFEPLRRVPRYYDDGEDAIIMVRRLDD